MSEEVTGVRRRNVTAESDDVRSEGTADEWDIMSNPASDVRSIGSEDSEPLDTNQLSLNLMMERSSEYVPESFDLWSTTYEETDNDRMVREMHETQEQEAYDKLPSPPRSLRRDGSSLSAQSSRTSRGGGVAGGGDGRQQPQAAGEDESRLSRWLTVGSVVFGVVVVVLFAVLR